MSKNEIQKYLLEDSDDDELPIIIENKIIKVREVVIEVVSEENSEENSEKNSEESDENFIEDDFEYIDENEDDEE